MDKYLWIDMEMTGLNVSQERIIEVAAIITDADLKPLDQYESVVFQDQSFIDNMDEWNTEHHTQSGLVAKIPSAPKQEMVEKTLCELVKKHFGKEPAILAGNSIGQDRKFIDAYMPELSALLHYRMLDVTAWKIIMNSRFQIVHDKKDSHRALDDILESIAELKTFIDFIENKGS
jgi:oligoribonuclease